jgi:magnesium chelatase family protein
MVQKVRSLGLSGILGYEVSVECFLSGGLPAFEKVGSRVQTCYPVD